MGWWYWYWYCLWCLVSIVLFIFVGYINSEHCYSSSSESSLYVFFATDLVHACIVAMI